VSEDHDIARPLAAIMQQIAEVERGFTHDVRVVAVTKGFGDWAIEAAMSAGCPVIGENYAQELAAKRDVIVRLSPQVHFIGRLQTNKVRLVADLVDVWASLDRAPLVDEVAKRAPAARVLIQVDTTGDPAKGGCAVADAPALAARARDLGLVVEGLMTVGPTGEPAESARAGFRQVRNLVDDLGLGVCSMGMSGDLAVAVQEGSTEVRIGTALFGPRPRRR
jgi:pyridoxal phosphate enzyme (YggS family)